jgi:hypothetical protein
MNGNYVAVGVKGIYGDGGKFYPNAKAQIKINEYNKRDFEETYLGGETIESAFENFKKNTKPKAETNTFKTPPRTTNKATITTKTGKTLTVPK